MSRTPVMHVALVQITSPLGQLWQSHQVLADGTRRDRNMPNLSEALEQGELAKTGAVRGVWEELGLDIPAARFQPIRSWSEEKPSPSNPGVKKRYFFYEYALTLTPDETGRAQLSVKKGTLTTYFEWRPTR